MDGRDAAEDELIARLIDARPAIKQRRKIDAKLIDDIIDSTIGRRRCREAAAAAV